MKKSNKVTFLTQAAVIAAIYVVLTIIFAPFSFGEVLSCGCDRTGSAKCPEKLQPCDLP